MKFVNHRKFYYKVCKHIFQYIIKSNNLIKLYEIFNISFNSLKKLENIIFSCCKITNNIYIVESNTVSVIHTTDIYRMQQIMAVKISLENRKILSLITMCMYVYCMIVIVYITIL